MDKEIELWIKLNYIVEQIYNAHVSISNKGEGDWEIEVRFDIKNGELFILNNEMYNRMFKLFKKYGFEVDEYEISSYDGDVYFDIFVKEVSKK